jgi:hypothetical protein
MTREQDPRTKPNNKTQLSGFFAKNKSAVIERLKNATRVQPSKTMTSSHPIFESPNQIGDSRGNTGYRKRGPDEHH